MAQPARRRLRRIGVNIAGVLVALVALFPVYWMVLTSFRPGELQHADAVVPADQLTLDNYRRVFEREYFWTAMKNSAMVTGIVVGSGAERRVLRRRGAVPVPVPRPQGVPRSTIILIQMVPAEALVISLFQVLDGVELTNRIIGLALTYLVFVLPFTIWTLRGFVSGVPLELEEAARVDGASRFGAFMRVTLPLVAPGLVATGIFAFIQSWNEFIFALVIMNRPENADDAGLAAGLQRGCPRHGLGWRDGRVDADGGARDHLLPHRPAQGHGRPDRGRGQGLNCACADDAGLERALRSGRRRRRRHHDEGDRASAPQTTTSAGAAAPTPRGAGAIVDLVVTMVDEVDRRRAHRSHRRRHPRAGRRGGR